MYQNCCKKCGSTDLYTNQKGNNTGLYGSDCGAWIKWLSKEELRAFDHSKDIEEENIKGLSNTRTYYTPKLNLDKVETVDDCKKILKFLCDFLKPIEEGITYKGFDEVKEYFDS